jgi:hypothetical protein
MTEAHGINADYLRTRCGQERERLWADVSGADAFDSAADAFRRTVRLDPVTGTVRAALVSPRLHQSGALVGLLVMMNAWWSYSFGAMELSPKHLLLFVAMAVLLVALLASLFRGVIERVAAKLEPSVARQVMVFGVPALVLASVLALCVSVLALYSRKELLDASAWDNTAETLFVAALLGLGLTLPFARSASNSERITALSFNRNAFLLMVGVLGGVWMVAFVATSGDAYRIVYVEPSDELFMAGFAVTLCSALIALTGMRLQPLPVLRERYRRAEETASSELAQLAVLPLLRNEINKNTQNYDVTINVTEAPGLSQLSDPMYKVSTDAAERVEKLLKTIPGGSIGLAGSRGAGKTTLIESYCTGQHRPSDALTTMVSAPVEYSSREFLLHLYAKICREVLGSDGAHGIDPMWVAHLRRRRLLLALYAAAAIAVGSALVVFSGLAVRTPTLWGALLVSAGMVMAFRTAFLPGPRDVRRRAGSRRLSELAAERLEEIRFQQSFTSTWSRSLKTPFGVEAMTGGGRGLTRQQLNLPEIVDSLREFLERAAEERRVIIGIDELDKMESETAAEQFLNEIKSVFGVRGCYFLVSVSEDAMSSFERRGLPFRDVFDSTFDEIVWFEPLTLAETIASIDRRVVLMPVPFKQLCFALSGGLPRDLIRVARLTVNAQDPQRPSDLSQVAACLITQDVKRKARAIAVAARRIDLEPDVSQFLLTCSNISDTTIDSGPLLALVNDLLPSHTSRARLESTTASAGAYLKLVGELSCFCYYAATVLDFFDTSADRHRWLAAANNSDHVGLHHLAKARQAFAMSTRVAWEGISRFRYSWNMTPLPFPTELEPETSSAEAVVPSNDNANHAVVTVSGHNVRG